MKVFQSFLNGFKDLRHLSLVLGLITVLFPFVAEAGQGFKHGVVMSRAVVLDEQGQPILVEFKENGTEGDLVSVPEQYRNAIDSLKIISASEYRFHEDRLEQYLQLHENDLALGAEVMDRAQFESSVFKAADNETVIEHPELSENVKSVLVRGQSNRILPKGDELPLLTFPVNLAQTSAIITENDRSVLLTEDGNVIATSIYNIAYRVGFYGDANEAQDPSGSYHRDQANDTVFAGVKVSVSEEAYPGGIAYTDEDGKYSFTYYLPTCPLGGFEFTTDVYAELKYQNFRPIGAPALPYYLRRQQTTIGVTH